MVYIKYKIKTTNLPEFLPDILIAKLAEMGMESFQEEGDFLMAYGQQKEIDTNKIDAYLSNMFVDFEVEEIQPENWNQKWEENFRFIEIDDKVLIYAKFHEREKKYPFEIQINPKMAFGTGHHQTTRLVIQHMLEMDLSDKTLLDFGTGTAVLAILAEKMKAKHILGVDIDDWSVNNALENIQINQSNKIEIVQGNGDNLPQTKYDVILANVNRNVLLEKKEILISRLSDKKGVLILSGLLQTDLDIIRNAYEPLGLKFQSVKQEDEWIAVRFLYHL